MQLKLFVLPIKNLGAAEAEMIQARIEVTEMREKTTNTK
jgi:hypothetical protein